MRTARTILGLLLPVLVSIATALPTPGIAQTNDVDPEALRLLSRATDYLKGLKQFRVETETTIEAVLSTGQKLQFGHHVSLAVKRPNKLRAERVGELISQTFYYDGTTLSVNLPDMKYYATAQAPPTIEQMLGFARDKLDVIAPASDLVQANAFELLTEGLTSAFVVGKAVVRGARCDHVAFRNAEVDWQIWIQEGDKPLPRKFVVTSKRMPQSPEFAVVLAKWESSPELIDAMFRFVPPKGSKRIDFVPAPGAAKN